MKIQYLGFLPLILVYIWCVFRMITRGGYSDGTTEIARLIFFFTTLAVVVTGLFWGIGFFNE